MGQPLVLPMPPRPLSPNSNAHWRQKRVAGAAFRDMCESIVLQLGVRLWPAGEGDVLLVVTPVANRLPLPDADNVLAALKRGVDGVCAALGVDDSVFGAILTHRARLERGVEARVELRMYPVLGAAMAEMLA